MLYAFDNISYNITKCQIKDFHWKERMVKSTYTARRIRMRQMMMTMVVLSLSENVLFRFSDFIKTPLHKIELCIYELSIK